MAVLLDPFEALASFQQTLELSNKLLARPGL